MGLRGGRAGAVLLLVVLFGCVAWNAGAAQVKKSSVEESIRDCANRERRERGLKALKEDSALDAAARYHARHMLAKGFFDHKDPSGDGPGDRVKRFAKRRYVIVGENIAAGFESTAAVCRGWMKSPGHRENILRHSFTRIGGGYASGESEYGRYYVQVFADVPG